MIAAARAADATTIVVGLPLSLSGRIGPAARATLEEVEALRVAALALGIDVVVHDERSRPSRPSAACTKRACGRDARKQVVDKVAAAVMLQSWLDREAASGEEHA